MGELNGSSKRFKMMCFEPQASNPEKKQDKKNKQSRKKSPF